MAPQVAPDQAAAALKAQFAAGTPTGDEQLYGRYIEAVLVALSLPITAANVLGVRRLLRERGMHHSVAQYPKQITVGGLPVVADSPEHEKELLAKTRPVAPKPLPGEATPAAKDDSHGEASS